MSEPIDFNPKFIDPAKYDWGKDLNTLEGYESPIAISFEQIANEIRERQEDAVIATISERMAVDIDKKELEKALAFDRDQYSKGFRAGYERALSDIRLQVGQAVGILNDILNQSEEKEPQPEEPQKKNGMPVACFRCKFRNEYGYGSKLGCEKWHYETDAFDSCSSFEEDGGKP